MVLYLCNKQAIDLKTQLKYFGQVEKWLTEKFGDLEGKEIISNAVYMISMGSNDYLGGYVANPEMQQLYQPPQYVQMVLGNVTEAIQVTHTPISIAFPFKRWYELH